MANATAVVPEIKAMPQIPVLNKSSGQGDGMSHQVFMFHEGTPVKVNDMQVTSLLRQYTGTGCTLTLQGDAA